MAAQLAHGALEITDQQGQTPEARRTIRSTRALDHLLGLCDQLEDLLAQPEERLARRPRRRRLLAHAAQVKARRPQSPDAAIEVRRDRHDVVDRHHTVRMLGRNRRDRPLGHGRRQPVELRARRTPQRPAEDPPVRAGAVNVSRTPPSAHEPSATVNPSAAHRSASSAIRSSSIVTPGIPLIQSKTCREEARHGLRADHHRARRPRPHDHPQPARAPERVDGDDGPRADRGVRPRRRRRRRARDHRHRRRAAASAPAPTWRAAATRSTTASASPPGRCRATTGASSRCACSSRPSP